MKLFIKCILIGIAGIATIFILLSIISFTVSYVLLNGNIITYILFIGTIIGAFLYTLIKTLNLD